VEKPFPRIFEIGLAAVGAVARETLYVGDIYAIDVLGAQDAGLQAVLIDPLGEYDVFCQKTRSLGDLLPLLPGGVTEFGIAQDR
jgi:FMN phosphatase YigB (HAD superfamily)